VVQHGRVRCTSSLHLRQFGAQLGLWAGRQTLDFAVVRNFSITESARFEFRAEFFNALNHTNLGMPDRFVNTPQVGTITEAATPGREIQLSARLSL
jgi:hypothetical protein